MFRDREKESPPCLTAILSLSCFWSALPCVPAVPLDYGADLWLRTGIRLGHGAAHRIGEAVIDVVARDQHNLPIRNLTENEFEVYETAKHGSAIPKRILYLRTIDPEQRNREENSSRGFHVSSGAVCALDSAVHYQIAIQASPEPGYHTVLIKTTRRHVILTFRRRYYVGHTRENATQKNLQKLVTPEALYEAACYHPLHRQPLQLPLKCSMLPAEAARVTR